MDHQNRVAGIKALVPLLILLAAGALNACGADHCGHAGCARPDQAAPAATDVELAINGGSFQSGAFPNVGMLMTITGANSWFQCTATLIRPDVILTAAHCVHDSPTTYFSAATMHFTLNESPPTDPAAEMAFFKTQPTATTVTAMSSESEGAYSEALMQVDLAMIKLDTKMTYAGAGVPLPLLSGMATALQQNDQATSVGYGLDNGSYPGRKQFGVLSYYKAAYDPSAALEFLPGPTSQTTNHGDSGGPLVYRNTLIGVTSGWWQNPPAPNLYTYADVFGDRAWITQTLAGFGYPRFQSFADAFTRADHPDLGSGWVESGGGTIALVNNRAQGIGPAAGGATANGFRGDDFEVFAEFDLSGSTTQTVGLHATCGTGSAETYNATLSGGYAALRQSDAGGTTALSSPVANAAQHGTLRFYGRRGTLSMHVGSALVATVTLPQAQKDCTIGFDLDAGARLGNLSARSHVSYVNP